MLQDRFHIFLVETEDSINIGSVARAMYNCGFNNLHLVSPIHFDRERASWSACWATPILDNIQIHDDLEKALSEMELVVGFTARHSKNRLNHQTLNTWVDETSFPEKVALLFGNEQNGLKNEHLEFCSTLVRIPSEPQNPSYNLAQAVLLALFEIYRKTWSKDDVVLSEKLADQEQLRYLNTLINDTLEHSDYYTKDTSPAVPHILSNLILRTKPSQRELGVLLSVFDHINKSLKKEDGI